MQNSENGKNGKEKEIDRLLQIIDSVARVDTKLDDLDAQYRIDIKEIKQLIETIDKRIDDLEKRRSDLVQQVCQNANEISELKEYIARWKLYWSAISFIAVPLFTYLIVKLMNIAFHLPV
jgi:predicted  nucleic acid-binding Zn-ribbon protein